MEVGGINSNVLTISKILSPPGVKSHANDVIKNASTDSGTLDKKIDREAYSKYTTQSLDRTHKFYDDLGSRAQKVTAPDPGSATDKGATKISQSGQTKTLLSSSALSGQKSTNTVFRYDSSANLEQEQSTGGIVNILT